MSRVDELRQAVFDAMLPEESLGYDGAADKLRAFEQAVRDEEFARHTAKRGCLWDGPDDCGKCPCEGTRYCE